MSVPGDQARSIRDIILDATSELLAESSAGAVSTRAICERAGIQAPTLYRQFGDKDALIAQVVDRAFQLYLDSKRNRVVSPDPQQTLRNGWDSHVAWALANPSFYRVIYSSGVQRPAGVDDAHAILLGDLEACAAAGGLKVSPPIAAQMIMSATVGIAMMLIARPDQYPDPAISARLRDSVYSAVFTDEIGPGGSPEKAPSVAATALTLSSLVSGSETTGLTAAEKALAIEWLGRIADSA